MQRCRPNNKEIKQDELYQEIANEDVSPLTTMEQNSNSDCVIITNERENEPLSILESTFLSEQNLLAELNRPSTPNDFIDEINAGTPTPPKNVRDETSDGTPTPAKKTPPPQNHVW